MATKNKAAVLVLQSGNKDDMAQAIDCMSECFCGTTTSDGRFIYEPLNKCTQMSAEMKREYLAKSLPRSAADGLCVIVKDEHGKVVGASLTELFNPQKPLPKLPPCYSQTAQIYEFLDPIDREFVRAVEAQTGQRMEANQWAYLSILAVRGRVPGLNIADAIFIRTIELAKKRKLKGIFGEFSNPKSERVGLRNGFVPILNAEGKPIELCYANDPFFKAIDPKYATHCKMLVKWLNYSKL